MDEVISIGPFLMKWNMVSIILSGILGYSLIKYDVNRKMEAQKNQVIETIGNSILMSFGIWKLSLIVVNPISVVINPMNLVYFSGGYRGWMIALVSVFAYVFYHSKKQKVPLWRYFQWYGLGFFAANFLYHVIFGVLDPTDPLFHLSQIFFSGLFIWWFYKATKPDLFFQGFIWFGIGQIFLLFFKDIHFLIWLGLSRDQLIFLVVTLIGFMGSMIQSKMVEL